MGIIDRALSVLGYQKAVGPLIDDQRIFRSLRQLTEGAGSVVSAPYKQSIWVYSCINTIAQNLQRVPWLLKKDAGTLEPDIIETGPLYELFLNPNPYMTGKTLIEATFIYFCLRGEAFWILDGRDNISQIPKEIWTFDPLRFEEVQSKTTGLLLGWKYKGITDTFFSVDEVIQFKMFNPYNDIRGLAPMEASRLSVDQDYQSSQFNKAFFDNGAKVGGFISIPKDVDLTDEQFNRLVKQFEDRHVGAGINQKSKAHKIAVVEGGGQFTEAKLTQKDMDFIEGKKLTRQEICSAYKVNEVVLGIYSGIKSYEGIKAAHKAFWEECLVPKIEYFQEVLWAKFFSKIGVRRGKGRIWGEFDLANVGPLQANYYEKVKTAMNMFHMGWPINDINKRLQLGMKEVPWGNEWWVPGGFLPVTSLTNGKPEKDDPKDIVPDDNKTLVLRSPLEVEFKSKLKKFLFEQRKKTIAEIFGGKNWDSIRSDKEYSKLKEALRPIYRDAINCGIFYVQQKEEEGIVVLSEVEGNISIHAESRACYIVAGYKSIVDTVLQSAEESDISAEILGDKMRGVYNLLSSKVAMMAKSEVDSAFVYGRELAAQYIRKALYPSLEMKVGEMRLLK